MCAKVFIIEETRQDTDEASRFGEIEVLFSQRDHRPSIWDASFYAEALKCLEARGYDNKRDFLVVVGAMVPVVGVIAALLTEFGSIHVLFYDSRHRQYVDKELGR